MWVSVRKGCVSFIDDRDVASPDALGIYNLPNLDEVDIKPIAIAIGIAGGYAEINTKLTYEEFGRWNP